MTTRQGWKSWVVVLMESEKIHTSESSLFASEMSVSVLMFSRQFLVVPCQHFKTTRNVVKFGNTFRTSQKMRRNTRENQTNSRFYLFLFRTYSISSSVLSPPSVYSLHSFFRGKFWSFQDFTQGYERWRTDTTKRIRKKWFCGPF